MTRILFEDEFHQGRSKWGWDSKCKYDRKYQRVLLWVWAWYQVSVTVSIITTSWVLRPREYKNVSTIMTTNEYNYESVQRPSEYTNMNPIMTANKYEINQKGDKPVFCPRTFGGNSWFLSPHFSVLLFINL